MLLWIEVDGITVIEDFAGGLIVRLTVELPEDHQYTGAAYPGLYYGGEPQQVVRLTPYSVVHEGQDTFYVDHNITLHTAERERNHPLDDFDQGPWTFMARIPNEDGRWRDYYLHLNPFNEDSSTPTLQWGSNPTTTITVDLDDSFETPDPRFGLLPPPYVVPTAPKTAAGGRSRYERLVEDEA